MQNILVGIIGHIDHGKTSLIKAISGFDGDSTNEEKKRGITIDISFSHIYSDTKVVTLIDVPGHEDLVKNMIAGAFSIDGVILTISSIEGIKPQTIEHFWICKLLDIQNITVAITKCDLATSDKIDSIKKDIYDFFLSNDMKKPNILTTSIYDQNSIETLKKYLFDVPKKYIKDFGFFRYYIDRVFSIKGAGTITTGTVLSGNISPKDKVFLLDSNKELNIKSIQTHHHLQQTGTISTRAALNIANIDTKDLSRGMQISKKGVLRGFNSIDVSIELLQDMQIHDNTYQLYIGSAKFEVKILLLSHSENNIFATIVSKKPIFAIFGDRFVLRNGTHTIGGGKILAPIADPMKKSQKIELLSYLSIHDFKSAFVFLANIHKKGFGLISAIQRFGITRDECIAICHSIDTLFIDTEDLVLYVSTIPKLLEDMIKNIYTKNKYALISKSFVNERFKWCSKYLAQTVLDNLVSQDFLILENGLYRQKDVEFTNMLIYIEDTIYDILDKSNFTPDAPYNIYDSLDLDRQNGDKAFKKLTSMKKIQRLAHNYYITTNNLLKVKDIMVSIIKNDGYIDIHNLKQNLNISRKYLIPLLEYLDTMPNIYKNDTKRFLR